MQRRSRIAHTNPSRAGGITLLSRRGRWRRSPSGRSTGWSRRDVTEVRGGSLAVHGGDGSDNRALTAGIKPPDSVSGGKHNGQKLAVGLGSARMTKGTTPSPRGRLRGRGDTAGKKRPSPACACPPWREGQAGRWHGPCPDAGNPATGGIPAVPPRRTGCTVQADTASERTPNTPHPSRGRRIAHEPGIALLDPIRRARSCQRGRGTGPLSRVGILALQRGEDVKDPPAPQSQSGSQSRSPTAWVRPSRRPPRVRRPPPPPAAPRSRPRS
jgi:hypothetical protein